MASTTNICLPTQPESLWYEVVGAGPELVLVHGWGMHAGVWQPWLPLLTPHFRVTVLELPGHGASPVIPADLNRWAVACLAVAPPQAVWLGWSLGGLVTLQAALLAPQRIRKLCLLTATPRFVQADDWSAAVSPEVFKQFAATLAADPNLTLRRFINLQLQGGANARQMSRTLQMALNQRPAASLAGLQAGLTLLLQTDLRAELAHLPMPLTWLFGEKDTLVPAKVAEYIPSLAVDTQQTVLTTATHTPFLTDPKACLAWLEPLFAH